MAVDLIQRERSTVERCTKFNLAAWKNDFLAQLLSPI